jgi:glycosyltransferase involved in cell wall biosynthesis
MPKIKILFCLETIGWGGVESRRLSIVQSLDLNKYEIKIVCTKAIGLFKIKLENLGVEIFEVGEFKSFFEFKKLLLVRKIIKKYQPSIIHGGVFEGNTMAVISSRFIPGNKVILEETSDPKNRSKKAHFLLKLYSIFADKFIAISPSVLKYLINQVKIHPSKVVLITNGVPFPRFVSSSEIHSLRKNLGINDSNFVIGSVGRLLNFHKRFTDIIKAVSLLPENLNVKILIVGEGPDKELIKETAHELGLEHNLILAGLQMDTAPYYQLMDVFCLVSYMEGFGLVFVEAMFNELAVIGSKVGGIVDIIDDNENGFLVNPQDPKEVSIKIDMLMYNDRLRKEMGINGFNKANREFSVERYTNEVKQLYDSILL